MKYILHIILKFYKFLHEDYNLNNLLKFLWKGNKKLKIYMNYKFILYLVFHYLITIVIFIKIYYNNKYNKINNKYANNFLILL